MQQKGLLAVLDGAEGLYWQTVFNFCSLLIDQIGHVGNETAHRNFRVAF